MYCAGVTGFERIRLKARATRAFLTRSPGESLKHLQQFGSSDISSRFCGNFIIDSIAMQQWNGFEEEKDNNGND